MRDFAAASPVCWRTAKSDPLVCQNSVQITTTRFLSCVTPFPDDYQVYGNRRVKT